MSPHLNHREQKLVRCSAQAQHGLRLLGITRMGDVLTPTWEFLPWHAFHPGDGDWPGERAYQALLSNLRVVLSDAPGSYPVFFEEDGNNQNKLVWQFDVPSQAISSGWPLISGNFTPVKTLRATGGLISNSLGPSPSAETMAHRVFLRLPSGRVNQHSVFGPGVPILHFLSNTSSRMGLRFCKLPLQCCRRCRRTCNVTRDILR